MQFGAYMTQSASMFLLATSSRQYPRPAGCPVSGERSSTIVCSSAAFTPRCSEGSFRNQVTQTATHRTPTAPNHTKTWRQDMNWSSHNTSAGVRPPTR